ncbi:hypothetical protein E1292_14975 [Nonomuraea deserti]|uniref:Uncharacterized protein n=1 Tax=Nonomuraea deserti TaxID=1848322 RepID=A0A4R4VTK5_9ACTN|nr:hypothetical protein [Nonomuraea deserti]TDD06613.1 hypothetical protein E1292_14975 [Nonomuraea deserti]
MRFRVREFELALMHRMRDLNAGRVEDALAAMGASRAEVRAAHTHWTRLAHASRAPKGAAVFRMALGPPHHAGPRAFGSLTCDVRRWILPSWPGLEFEVLTGPDGEVWNQWFVRPGGGVRLAFADLTPWTCVVADVGTSFPGATSLEGQAPHHWSVEFDHAGTAYRACFVYGLYQRLDRRDGGPAG